MTELIRDWLTWLRSTSNSPAWIDVFMLIAVLALLIVRVWS